MDCVNGEYTLDNHKEWISREDFYRKKDDISIALIWSFGNNGQDYLYGRQIEPYKKAMHYAAVYHDLSLLNDLGITIHDVDSQDIYERYLHFRKEFDIRDQTIERINRLQNMTALRRCESLQRLRRCASDYRSVIIPKNSIVYCDPPYNKTNCGKYRGFDNKAFYEWAIDQDNIFISEYEMPLDFIEIARCEKTLLCNREGNTKVIERLFTNEKTIGHLLKPKQMTIFDFMR